MCIVCHSRVPQLFDGVSIDCIQFTCQLLFNWFVKCLITQVLIVRNSCVNGLWISLASVWSINLLLLQFMCRLFVKWFVKCLINSFFYSWHIRVSTVCQMVCKILARVIVKSLASFPCQLFVYWFVKCVINSVFIVCKSCANCSSPCLSIVWSRHCFIPIVCSIGVWID